MAGVPVVVNTLHGFYFHDNMASHWRRFYITTEKIAARCSDVILSQNREDIETAIAEGICPRQKIRHLGNGIDVRHFDPDRLDRAALAHKRRQLGIPDDAHVVGFVGRLVAEKGILELLASAQVVHRQLPNTRFLIVGPMDHDKADALTPQIAEKYGLANVCIFTGLRQDMPDLYALMDLFVLPSHREGFPRSPMEASAMGVPSVATDIRGCREAVAPGRNGLLVPLGDGPALTDAMMALLRNEAKRRTMGETARQMALTQFDERLIFERVKEVYAELLARKGIAQAPGISTPVCA
jgi:glycosyltransferase involved in cell wall biosynthesis